MATRTSFRPLAALSLALVTAPFASGCELFVHFDRSRIDQDTNTVDGGVDGAAADAGMDGGHDAAPSIDANLPDTNADAGTDAFVAPDMGNDGGNDGGSDANLPDTGVDAGCMNPATDCPAPPTCEVAICTSGGCSTTPAPTTTHCGTGGSMFCDGAGACVACNAPADCGTDTECQTHTCTSHVCGVMNLGTSHTVSTGQVPGDCQKIVCDGSGGTTSADDPTDLPTSSSVCLINPSCSGSPLAPHFDDAPATTTCTSDGGHVCGDPAGSAGGTCVECNVDGDCTATTCDTSTHSCT